MKTHARVWRTYGNDPLPTPRPALNGPLRRFPSWFLRVECSRRGAVQVINEVHAPRRQTARTLRSKTDCRLFIRGMSA
jgi:hypothetical protein